MKRNNKRFKINLLLILLFAITLGYAYLNSNLSINGTTSIAGNTWDIHFINLNISEGSVTASTPAVIDTNDNTKVNYSVRLEKPGDYYEFKVDIKNFGTLPGKVSEVSLTGIDNTYSNFLEYYIGYSKYREVLVNDLLNPNDYKTITVRVAYKDDITSSELPDSNIILNLSFQVTYVQSQKYEPVMLTYSEITSTTNYESYKTSIDTVIFSHSLNTFYNAVEVWDFGVIPGTVKASLVPNYNDNTKYTLYIFGDGGLVAPRDSSNLFGFLNSLKNFYGLNYLDTYNVTNMSGMFKNTGMDNNGLHLDLGNNFDTSNVTNMREMFYWTGYNNQEFTLNLGNKFDTSNVTNMYMMFWKTGYYSQIFTLDLNDNFDTGKVINMNMMFYDTGYTSPVFTLDLGEKFSTKNVVDMNSMFFETGKTSNIFTLNLGTKFDTSNVTDMTYLFYYVGYSNPSFTLNIGDKFKLDSAINMQSVFYSVAYNNPNFELDLSLVNFKNEGNFENFIAGFKETQRIYVKNENDRNWIISNFGSNPTNHLSTSNVLIKS